MMPIGWLLLAGFAGAVIYEKSRKTTVGAGGPPGTIVDVNPFMGHKNVNISQGQTVRVNLPSDWFVLQDASIDPIMEPMQRVPARGSGIAFTAATLGRQTLTFAKSGTLDTVTIDVTVAPMQYGTGQFRRAMYRPYRDFWGRFGATNPYWRWHEEQWRLYGRWDPSLGVPPPPPAHPVLDAVPPPPPPA